MNHLPSDVLERIAFAAGAKSSVHMSRLATFIRKGDNLFGDGAFIHSLRNFESLSSSSLMSNHERKDRLIDVCDDLNMRGEKIRRFLLDHWLKELQRHAAWSELPYAWQVRAFSARTVEAFSTPKIIEKCFKTHQKSSKKHPCLSAIAKSGFRIYPPRS